MDHKLQSNETSQSYQVIARKWRPQNFGDLIGQEHIAQTLLNALRNQRLPQALIFNGVRGTGKTSSARILAKALRCQQPVGFEPCGKCSECLDISAGRSVDVIEIDGASNNGVDSIRDLRDSVNYKPATGRYKVYIIDEVHMLSTAAFNALLKTLEEPPEHVVFVLATTEVQKIPSTILSRAQRFEFRRIPSRKIADHLETICRSEGFEADPDALWLIARKADGSMRDSQSLLDQAITFSQGRLTVEKLTDILGLTTRSLILAATQALIEHSTEQTLKVVESIDRAGVDPKLFASDLLEEIRNALVLKLANAKKSKGGNVGQQTDLVDLPDSEIAHLQQLVAEVPSEDLHMLFDMVLKGANEISKSPLPHLVLEMVLFRAASAPSMVSLSQLLSAQPVPLPSSHGAGRTSASLSRTARSTPLAKAPSGQLETQTSLSEPAPGVAVPAQTDPSSTDKYTMNSFVKRLKPGPTEQAAGTKPTSSPARHSQATTVGSTSGGGQASAPPSLTASTTSSEVEPTDPWQSFVYRVRKSNGLLGAMLENTHIVSQTSSTIVLGVPKKVSFVIDKMKEPENIKRIQQFLLTLWNKSLDVQIIAGEPGDTGSVANLVREELTPRAQEKKREIEKEKTIESTVEQNPLVRSARDIFRGQIKQIKNPD